MKTLTLTKDEILDAIEKLALCRHAKFGKEGRQRELMITPFPGARGTAGVIIAVNGTPPQSLFALIPSGNSNGAQEFPDIVDLSSFRVRKIRRSEKPAYQALSALFSELRWETEAIVL